MSRAIIYTRVSTDEQVDGSGLAQQREACERRCQAEGWDVLGVLSDEGVTGRKGFEARPGLADAVGLVVDGDVDVIVVAAVDRLARDVIVLEVVLRRVWDAGGQVVSCRPGEEDAVREDSDDEPMRRVVRLIVGALAEYERSMIAMRVRGGRRRKLAEGGYGGGPTPFGWENDWQGGLVRVAAEQATVAAMVALRAEGRPLSFIADELNRRGLHNRTGRPWSKGAVARALAAASPAERGDGGGDDESADPDLENDRVKLHGE